MRRTPAPTTELPRTPGAGPGASQAAPAADGTDCEGCPPRRLGTAFVQVTLVNVIYELANLARGQVTARITPKTWWTNMERGWEWDLDDFVVNQIGHPYQGNNYFTTGRANGLDFWESSALTAFGSGTWEYFGETNQASLNDFINTTLGGIALGEMFHRTAWLVRDTRATGRSRLMKEIGAMVIDPMTGLNRFLSGDASRVVEKPPGLVPSSLGAVTSAGALWRDSTTADASADVHPFVEVDLLYGDLTSGRSRTPYDAFAVRFDFGGGSPISEAACPRAAARSAVSGRSAAAERGAGLPVHQERCVSVRRAVLRREPRHHTATRLAHVSGGRLAGEASPSWAPSTRCRPECRLRTRRRRWRIQNRRPGRIDRSQVLRLRPGHELRRLLQFQRDGRGFLTFSYQLHHLHVLDGVRANHLLQRARADLRVPLRGRLGIGVSGEFFDRRTFYQAAGRPRRAFSLPPVQGSLTWSTS